MKNLKNVRKFQKNNNKKVLVMNNNDYQIIYNLQHNNNKNKLILELNLNLIMNKAIIIQMLFNKNNKNLIRIK